MDELACARVGGFGGECEGAYVDGEAGFFEEFTGESACGGLAELDVAAWKVVVPFGDVAAEEDVGVFLEDASDDEFNVIGHWGLFWGKKGPQLCWVGCARDDGIVYSDVVIVWHRRGNKGFCWP